MPKMSIRVPFLGNDELAVAKAVIDGASADELEGQWRAEGRKVRRLWHILDDWADRGWWDYGVTIRGGWLTEDGRDALLSATSGRRVAAVVEPVVQVHENDCDLDEDCTCGL